MFGIVTRFERLSSALLVPFLRGDGKTLYALATGSKITLSKPWFKENVALFKLSKQSLTSPAFFLDKLLKSISEQENFSRYEILLLHNLSSDYESSIPKTIFTNPKPLGLAENLNFLIKKVQSPVTLILNPDTELPRFCLQTCLKILKTDHVLSCPAFHPDGRRLVNLRAFPSFIDILWERFVQPDSRLQAQAKLELKPNQNCWLQGSFLMTHTENFRRVGFDPSYNLYFEDVDFFRRARKLGISVQYEQSTHYVHQHCRASSAVFSSAFWTHCRSATRYFTGF